MAQLVAHQERHLGAGADHQAAVVVEPADAAVGLEVRVLDARWCCQRAVAPPRAPRRASRPRRRRPRRAARRRRCATGRRSRASAPLSPCSSGAPGAACRLGVEDRGQHLVLDVDRAGRRLRRSRRVSATTAATRCPTEAHDVVEHAGVVGVVVARSRGGRWRTAPAGCPGGSAPARTPGDGLGRGGVDRDDAGVRRAGCPARRGAAGPAAAKSRVYCSVPVHDPARRRAPTRAADASPAVGSIVLTVPATRVADRAVAGAPAEVSLQRLGQVGAICRRSSVDAVVTMPAVQKPHWKPAASTNGAAPGAGRRACRARRPW